MSSTRRSPTRAMARGGVAVLLRVLTDNKNRTGPAARHIFERNSGHMGTAGCVAWMFERRGADPG